MNKVREAVYIGSRNFCRKHPDMFVFSEFDSDNERVTLTIEYNGGFAIAKELKDTKNPYVFGPRISHYIDYAYLLRSNKPHEMVQILLSNLHAEMMSKFDLTFKSGQ